MCAKGRLFAAAAAAVLLALAGAVRAADPERGRMLYENHCHECHESVVHVREARKAGTRADVRRRIVQFARFLDLGWGEAEVADVLHYLNSRYYGFGEGSVREDQPE